MPKNKQDGVVFDDPKSAAERAGLAKTCTKTLALTLPTVVDAMDDKANKDYGAWPERLYVVGKDGKVAYKGGEGPRNYDPRDLEKFLAEHLAKPENRKAP